MLTQTKLINPAPFLVYNWRHKLVSPWENSQSASCESEKLKLYNNYSSRLNGQLVLILIACNRGIRRNTLKSKTKLTNLEIFNVTSLSDVKFKEGFANLTRLMLTVSSTMEIERNNPYLANASGLSLSIPVLARGESQHSNGGTLSYLTPKIKQNC